ncbi:HipA domain-containing protein [Lacisediminihabitans changchengi]|uniref:HipA domain-containing protein n=1 Tax=Lacisediminihabitans changchengi TaxID=2787634 RepID=A0A934W3G8_9MICO|nr:HipA domain-containing protein [Lacisediminihabitans changchengi]MBK4348963.1 HipA domain-containing protein [Lacisediminihabitans changchengi]
MGSDREDVTTWEFLRVETRGASEKVWLSAPGGSSTGPETHWLFKPATVQSNGNRQVGDWAEAVAAAIAEDLSVPAAEARLAVRDGIEGVITRNVRPAEYDMDTGRLAMLDRIDVDLRDSLRDRSASIGHSLDNIRRTLDGYVAPPQATSWAACTAFDVFVGYLMLDALIGNGDRHEQNWSVLRARSSQGPADALAPAYDMEASLGFQLTDVARSARLRDPVALESFASKGLARRFDGDLKTPLVDLAARAEQDCTNAGRARLAGLLESVAQADFEALLGRHGGVSEVTRSFAGAVLEINGRRIQDAIRA